MFFDRITNVDPEKPALIYQNRSYTYGSLVKEVRKRVAYFVNQRADYLLCHSSETENLLNFLALMAAGQKSVFAGKNIGSELKIAYSEKYNLKVLDYVPESISETDFSYKPKESDYFLGVLTSGSTGASKIIWKDYQSWFSAFPVQSEIFGINAQDRVMVVDALAYSANLNTVIHALWTGATVVFTALVEAKNWPAFIKTRHISSVFLVPSHYRLLPENLNCDTVKSLVSAGEKMEPKLAAKLLRTFPEAILTEYYGAAELGHISYIQGNEIIDRPMSVGKAFPGVDIVLKEDKIWVNSPYISPEYRDQATVSDIGCIDADGYLTLLGREGRMFNRRGLNIFAEEIENVAILHPAITEAVLIQSRRNPAHIHLLLVKEKPVSQNELRDFLLQKIAKEKLPNKIIFTEDIPRNYSGKVDFKVLSKRPVDEDSAILF